LNVLTFLCRHLHLELCQLTRELNAIFETQITLEMVAYLIYLIRLFRYIYIHVTANDNYVSSLIDWINIYFWVSLYITMFFGLNYMCESVSAKVNLYIILKI